MGAKKRERHHLGVAQLPEHRDHRRNVGQVSRGEKLLQDELHDVLLWLDAADVAERLGAKAHVLKHLAPVQVLKPRFQMNVEGFIACLTSTVRPPRLLMIFMKFHIVVSA